MSFALIQAPLSRFVSTAANDGVGELLKEFDWGPGREVIVASFVVGFFRMLLMPIDTCKTVLQIEHKKGLAILLAKVRAGNIHVLYSGALANAASSFIARRGLRRVVVPVQHTEAWRSARLLGLRRLPSRPHCGAMRRIACGSCYGRRRIAGTLSIAPGSTTCGSPAYGAGTLLAVRI